MQNLYNLFFPLQLDSILSWRIILSAAVLLASLFYAYSAWKLARSSRLHSSVVSKKRESISLGRQVEQEDSSSTDEVETPTAYLYDQDLFEQDDKYNDERTIDQEEQGEDSEQLTGEGQGGNDVVDETIPARRKSFLVSMIKKRSSKKTPTTLQEDDNSEAEFDEPQDGYGDTDPLADSSLEETASNLEDEQVLQDQPDLLLMTSETVDLNEKTSKILIEREQLQHDLELLEKKQQRSEYEQKLINGLSQDPHHPGALERLADYYAQHDNTRKALPLYKRLIEKFPDNDNLLWKMAKVYRILGDRETAQILFKKALTLHPKTPKYATALVELYYEDGQRDVAIELMEKVVQWRPENTSYWKVLIFFYEELHDYAKIVEAYESLLITHPTDPTIKRKLLEARSQL